MRKCLLEQEKKNRGNLNQLVTNVDYSPPCGCNIVKDLNGSSGLNQNVTDSDTIRSKESVGSSSCGTIVVQQCENVCVRGCNVEEGEECSGRLSNDG